MEKLQNPWVVVGLLAVALFGGGVLLSGSTGVPAEVEDSIVIEDAIKGNPEAAVRLVEYSDFGCPACAAFQPVLDELLVQYGDQFALEFKHFPLGSTQAAVAAEAAGQQGQFFPYHDLLYERQGEWVQAINKQQIFTQYAGELGLDTDLFQQHLRSDTLGRKVMADRQEGIALVDDAGQPLITGTPTFFLNGEKMEYSTFEDFVTQIAVMIDPNSATTTEAASPVDEQADVRFGI